MAFRQGVEVFLVGGEEIVPQPMLAGRLTPAVFTPCGSTCMIVCPDSASGAAR